MSEALGGQTLPGYSLGPWRWVPPRRRWYALRTRSGRSSPPRAAPCWATAKCKSLLCPWAWGQRLPRPQGMCEGEKWRRDRVEEGKKEGDRRRRNTLSRALIFAPLFSNSFKTSRFPPRLAQWMAVDSSYTGKVKGQELVKEEPRQRN